MIIEVKSRISDLPLAETGVGDNGGTNGKSSCSSWRPRRLEQKFYSANFTRKVLFVVSQISYCMLASLALFPT